jgi:hypothetical protein
MLAIADGVHKMEIRFKQISGEAIQIIEKDTEHIIGHIFTPSGTSHDTPSSIQICGFDRAFDLWGCGIFSDGKGHAKQDIQLLFNKNSTKSFNNRFGSASLECHKCYNKNKECQCDKLKLYEKKELIVDSLNGELK